MIESHYEVLTESDGEWRVILTTEAEVEAIEAAHRQMRNAPMQAVKVERERFDPATNRFFANAVFTHDPRGGRGGRVRRV